VKNIEEEKIRQILIDFAGLAEPERQEFLGAMNAYLFASPQRRRAIVAAWKAQDEAAQPALRGDT